jgi:hypothetical protein
MTKSSGWMAIWDGSVPWDSLCRATEVSIDIKHLKKYMWKVGGGGVLTPYQKVISKK